MAKKLFSVVALSLVMAAGAFAQGAEAKSSAKNWISGEVGLLGGGVRYERTLNEKWSIGGEFFWNSLFFFWNSLGVEVAARYYPWAGTFYAELGAGFGTVTGTEDYTYTYSGRSYTLLEVPYSTAGFMIAPAVGWRIDVGQPGGFYLNPSVAIPMVLGAKSYTWAGGGTAPESAFKFGVNFKAALGLGYAF
jgi:hypothetical protein